MKLYRNYRRPSDMPGTLPLFPLDGALLLPRRPIQLTVDCEPGEVFSIDATPG